MENVDIIVLFFGTLAAWVIVEFARVFTGRPTISEKVRDLDAYWPSVGFLTALVFGLLVGHFFLNPGIPALQAAGVAAGLAFGLLAGKVWFR